MLNSRFKIVFFLVEILVFETKITHGSVNITLGSSTYVTFLDQPLTLTCIGYNMQLKDFVWRFFYHNDPSARYIVYFNNITDNFNGKYSLNFTTSNSNYITSYFTLNSVDEDDLTKVFECVCNIYGACTSGERFARANITLNQTTTTSTTSTSTTSATVNTTTKPTTITTETTTTNKEVSTWTDESSTSSTTLVPSTTELSTTKTESLTYSTTGNFISFVSASTNTISHHVTTTYKGSTVALRQSDDKTNVCENDDYNLAQYILLVASTICFTVAAYLMIYKLHGFLSLDSSKKLKVAVNLSSVLIALNFISILIFWIKPNLANDKLNAPIIIVALSTFSCLILLSIISIYLIRIYKDNILPKIVFIWLICEIVAEVVLSGLLIFANTACLRESADEYDSSHIMNMKVVCACLFLTFALLVLFKTLMLICKKQISFKQMFTKIGDSSFLKGENRETSP